MTAMQLSEGRRRSIRLRALVLGAVLLAAVSATACGPPTRVHTGPAPVQLFSWEMGRNLPVYTGISDDVLARGGAGWDPQSAALDEPGQIVLFGHRVSKGAPFRTLDQLRLGNVITIVGSNRREYHYRGRRHPDHVAELGRRAGVGAVERPWADAGGLPSAGVPPLPPRRPRRADGLSGAASAPDGRQLATQVTARSYSRLRKVRTSPRSTHLSTRSPLRTMSSSVTTAPRWNAVWRISEVSSPQAPSPKPVKSGPRWSSSRSSWSSGLDPVQLGFDHLRVVVHAEGADGAHPDDAGGQVLDGLDHGDGG